MPRAGWRIALELNDSEEPAAVLVPAEACESAPVEFGEDRQLSMQRAVEAEDGPLMGQGCGEIEADAKEGDVSAGGDERGVGRPIVVPNRCDADQVRVGKPPAIASVETIGGQPPLGQHVANLLDDPLGAIGLGLHRGCFRSFDERSSHVLPPIE